MLTSLIVDSDVFSHSGSEVSGFHRYLCVVLMVGPNSAANGVDSSTWTITSYWCFKHYFSATYYASCH